MANVMNRILVEIQLMETAQAILHMSDNTYQKGDMYCVKVDDVVYKYPVSRIFRVKESYRKEMDPWESFNKKE